jgi:DNA repair protein RadC
MDKILENSCISLSRMKDNALLALLLSSNKIRFLSLEKCHEILGACENRLQNLFQLEDSTILLSGMIREDLIKLYAAKELIRRLQTEEVLVKPKISNSSDVYGLFRHLSECRYEEFWIVILNKANRVIKQERISEGGVSGTVVDPKKVYKLALDAYACSLILIHNHPSGNISPSEADKAITTKLVDAGKLLDIAVLDHIIIGCEQFYSFADNGNL